MSSCFTPRSDPHLPTVSLPEVILVLAEHCQAWGPAPSRAAQGKPLPGWPPASLVSSCSYCPRRSLPPAPSTAHTWMYPKHLILRLLQRTLPLKMRDWAERASVSSALPWK